VKKLLIANYLSPGDVVVLTAAIRDLHRNHPLQYLTDVDTTSSQIWENNPYIKKLKWKKDHYFGELPKDPKNNDQIPDYTYNNGIWNNSDKTKAIIHQNRTLFIKEPDIDVIHSEHDLINHCHKPFHYLHGPIQDLENKLNIRITPTEFKGDIHLSNEEKSWISQVEETGFKGNYWVILAGGKTDFTAKWWDPFRYQDVVNYFKGRIQFIQCGEKNHWHPGLKNVIDLRGKTDIRQFIRLIYHADGVLCPITFAMHLAAAVPTKPGKPSNRACVVIAGGREPSHWEAYPYHQFIHTCGALPCCDNGGCWFSRCQLVGDGDKKDTEGVCNNYSQVYKNLRIPKCMDMISVDMVIRRIEMYYEGGALKYY
jgi:ADP-heptose:LPS heptosyltransferase